ncbi:hypothetical protein AMK19_11305 [Kitasatospora sp. CB01950]|nr:hypothetical protein AMK19_11305 [Kitasatospora sp. CB01950]
MSRTEAWRRFAVSVSQAATRSTPTSTGTRVVGWSATRLRLTGSWVSRRSRSSGAVRSGAAAAVKRTHVLLSSRVWTTQDSIAVGGFGVRPAARFHATHRLRGTPGRRAWARLW